MQLTVLLECFVKLIVLLKYIDLFFGHATSTDYNFQPLCNSLPIMLALLSKGILVSDFHLTIGLYVLTVLPPA